MPAKLPDPITRINIKVFESDWAWMQQHRPGTANQVLRAMLSAWVRREQQKDEQQKG